jgi:hypothetical protein
MIEKDILLKVRLIWKYQAIQHPDVHKLIEALLS